MSRPILAESRKLKRVFSMKPRGFELKLIQCVENTAREDLTLDERLGNVRNNREYFFTMKRSDATLETLPVISFANAYYLAPMNAPDMQSKQKGNIRNG